MVGPDDAVLHGQEAIELVERQAEQGEEDLRRVRDGELRGEVDLAPVDEAVDEIVDQDGNLLLHGRHQAGGEDRVQQLAVLLVLGRVDLQRDHRPLVLEVDRSHVGREDLRMAEGLVDVGLAAQDDARALKGHHRAAVPQRLEHRPAGWPPCPRPCRGGWPRSGLRVSQSMRPCVLSRVISRVAVADASVRGRRHPAEGSSSPLTDWTSARSSDSGMMKLDANRRTTTSTSCSRLRLPEATAGHGVERVAQLRQKGPLQLGQVGQQIAQHELGLGLEERPGRVGADVVEGEGHEGAIR